MKKLVELRGLLIAASVITVLLSGGAVYWWINPESPELEDDRVNGAPMASSRAMERLPPPNAPASHQSGVWLTDVTKQSGITFIHTDGSSGRKYIVETVSAGLALFDYDQDGLIDIYLLNGAPLGPDGQTRRPTNALYRNLGDMRFKDVSKEAGIADEGFGLGVCVGDYDNDGDSDVYLNNFGPNRLYRNNGDGTFCEIAEEAHVGCGNLVGAGACFLDYDADGAVDLYVSNYVDFDYSKHIARTHDGYPCYTGPMDYQPVPDVLYRNQGDGTFEDVSDETGISHVAGTGMGIICLDYDADHDTDIFVLNDELANFLFENDGHGRFTEVGMLAGLAFDLDGKPSGNMGVDCADYDNDGVLDLFSTSYSREMPLLYRNAGEFFENVTLASGVGEVALPNVNWGTGFADFNNDGYEDLFLAMGHINDNVEKWSSSTSYRVKNQVLLNTGEGTFVDISGECGDGLDPVESSRGIGLDDLDNDGDIDIVILNSRSTVTVVRNDTRSEHHWLDVQLVGVDSNRHGIGAQVHVTADGNTYVKEVHSGRGYQSHHGTRLHFGLGDVVRIERVEVHWIGGDTDVVTDLVADQCITIIENTHQDTED